MTFQQELNITVVDIGDFEVVFFIPKAGSLENDTGRLRTQIVMSDNSLRHRTYDLLARLQDDAAGQAHLANLISLRNYIRARLENEVLP